MANSIELYRNTIDSLGTKIEPRLLEQCGFNDPAIEAIDQVIGVLRVLPRDVLVNAPQRRLNLELGANRRRVILEPRCAESACEVWIVRDPHEHAFSYGDGMHCPDLLLRAFVAGDTDAKLLLDGIYDPIDGAETKFERLRRRVRNWFMQKDVKVTQSTIIDPSANSKHSFRQVYVEATQYEVDTPPIKMAHRWVWVTNDSDRRAIALMVPGNDKLQV